MRKEYKGIEEAVKRFKPMTEKEELLFRIAYKLGYDNSKKKK